MNKKLFAAAALAATTFTAGLIGNVANANPAPAPKAPVVQQQDKKDVKAPKAEPQKKDVSRKKNSSRQRLANNYGDVTMKSMVTSLFYAFNTRVR